MRISQVGMVQHRLFSIRLSFLYLYFLCDWAGVDGSVINPSTYSYKWVFTNSINLQGHEKDIYICYVTAVF